MARIKTTEENIKSLIVIWANGENLTDELIFINGSIQTTEWISQAWISNIIITVEPDINGFSKFIYKEKL
jgi:hypothetical protein